MPRVAGRRARTPLRVRLACLDAHALVWHLSKPARLGRAAARLLRDADRGRTAVLIPAIVAVELTLLRQAGRNTTGVPQLESLRDPFDRMVVAAARAAGAPLVTGDATIHASALVDVVWD